VTSKAVGPLTNTREMLYAIECACGRLCRSCDVQSRDGWCWRKASRSLLARSQCPCGISYTQNPWSCRRVNPNPSYRRRCSFLHNHHTSCAQTSYISRPRRAGACSAMHPVRRKPWEHGPKAACSRPPSPSQEIRCGYVRGPALMALRSGSQTHCACTRCWSSFY
jgi:hypothetical protein